MSNTRKTRTSSFGDSPQRSSLTKRKPSEGEAAKYSPVRAASVPVKRGSISEDREEHKQTTSDSGDATSRPKPRKASTSKDAEGDQAAGHPAESSRGSNPASSSKYKGCRPRLSKQPAPSQPAPNLPVIYQPMVPVGQVGSVQLYQPNPALHLPSGWQCELRLQVTLVIVSCIIFIIGILFAGVGADKH